MCALGHSEKEHCEMLAQKMLPLLAKRGIEYRVRAASNSLTTNVNEATAFGAQLYVPMHTNATANGTARGTRFGYYPGRTDSMKACQMFRDNWKKIYPLPDRAITTTYTFAEAKNPKCPSVYCELVFHDNKQDAEWFHANIDRIAENLVESVALFFGISGVSKPEDKPIETAPVQPKKVSDTIVKLKITREENATFFKRNIGDIEELPLDEYLLGVVPAEIGNPHIEAAKAQAIAARTYAYMRVKNGNVIDDTTLYQAYRAPRSINNAYARAHQAVKETMGQVLTYNGKVIETAVYSHSNGGTMVSSKDRWGGDRPYLITADDPWTKATGEPKNGHAVGMSQVGAIYAAEHGVSYKGILAFYYPGTEITLNEAIAPTTPPVVPEEPPEIPLPIVERLYEATVVTMNPLSLNIWSNIRKSSSLKKVARGAVVDVLEEVNSGWAKVSYQGVVGYSDRKYLKPLNKDMTYQAKVVTMYPLSLNIWREARKGTSLAKVPKGAIVTVLSEVDATWAKVRYGDIVGYSDRKYLKRV
jgi:hypothetical protein